MHEFSLAQSLMQVVAESARREGISRVHRVKVVVGEWAAVLPDALTGSFAILACDSGDLFREARMEIVVQDATGECEGCGQRFPAVAGGLICPVCGTAARLITGGELFIDSYEGD